MKKNNAIPPLERCCMASLTANPEPVDAAIVPRFGAIPTFMRLPIEPTGKARHRAYRGAVGRRHHEPRRRPPRAARNPQHVELDARGASRQPRRALRTCAGSPISATRPVNPIDLERFAEAHRGVLCAECTRPARRRCRPAATISITLPIFRAIARERPVGMIHFDAHSDTNDRYFGDNEIHPRHAFPPRRRGRAARSQARSIQIGIRGSIYSADEMDLAESAGMRIVYMEEFFQLGAGGGDCRGAAHRRRRPDLYQLRRRRARSGLRAGHRHARDRRHLRRARRSTCSAGLQGLDLIGGDVVEVSPPFDPSGNTALVGATLMFEIMCLLADAVARRRGGKERPR